MNTATSSLPVVIAEFEDLVKIKVFRKEGEILPLQWTRQSVLKALEEEYSSNIIDKLDRWVEITNARYFQYAVPVIYYFQAKMLYRDGYYEAAIALSRSICEMICYDFLTSESHPFGTAEQIEQVSFRRLVNFLALPKMIPRVSFEQGILPKITERKEANLLKSSYVLNKSTQTYHFATANGKEAENLNRFHKIFDKVGWDFKGIFPGNTFKKINEVYDLGSTYVHARKSDQLPKQDAKNCINSIGLVLAHLYIVKGELNNFKVETGYNLFPDVCKGTNFFMDVYFTEEEARRGYYHAPSPVHLSRLLSLAGEWKGEWKNEVGSLQDGWLTFAAKGDNLLPVLSTPGSHPPLSEIEIRLFGNYFHLLLFTTNSQTNKKALFLRFELDIFSDHTLLGKELVGGGKALFTRKSTC